MGINKSDSFIGLPPDEAMKVAAEGRRKAWQRILDAIKSNQETRIIEGGAKPVQDSSDTESSET